jgi:hypothetical protein
MAHDNSTYDQSENSKQRSLNCPYLGIEEDPATWLSYANSANFCYKIKPARPVEPAHQRQFCLTQAYPICKIYTQNSASPLPSIATIEPRQERNPLRFFWISLAILSIITLLVVISFWLRANWDDLSGNSMAAQTPVSTDANLAASVLPSQIPTEELLAAIELLPSIATSTQSASPTPSLSPTLAHSPTASFTPTPTQPTPGPALNTPFGPQKRFLLHRVATGESLGNLAVIYRTSADVIRAANVLIEGASVWPDTILVIYPGVTDPSQVTRFQVVQLKSPAYPEDLAAEYQVSLEELLEHNLLVAQVLIPVGRWLVIPVSTP